MATYVNDLRLKEIATGDEAGTWGTSTNTNLQLIGEALGYGTQDCFASDADSTTTVADGATDPARAMYFKVTSSATLTATRTLTIAPNTVSRVMLIENATTGSQSIAISQGSGGNVTIASGQTKMVYLDGAGSGGAVVDALADLELGTITVADLTATTADINGGSVDGVTLGTNSAVTEAQIDNININGNTISSTDTNGNVTITPDGTGSVAITKIDVAGGEIDGTAIGGNSASTATFTDLTASGTVSFSGATVSNGGTVTTVDINGGTIDGVTIGGASAGAITGTTGQFNTSLNVDGTVTADGLISDGTTFVNLTSRPAGIPATAGALWTAQTETGNYGIATRASTTDSFTYIGNTGSAATLGQSYGSTGSYLPLVVQTSDLSRLKVETNGDISFYEDTGTTAKFFWDASAEALGIGTSSPQTPLSIETSGTQDVVSPVVTGQTAGVTYGGLYTVRDGAGDQRGLALQVYTANVGLNEVIRIDSSGNLGLGVTPSAWNSGYKAFQVKNISTFSTTLDANFGSNVFVNSGGNYAYIANGTASLYTQNSGIHSWSYAPSGTAGNTVSFSEAMRIDSAGNVGIGTDSPDTLMELRAANPVLTIRDTETSTASNDARLRLAETGVSDALGNYYDIGYIQGNLQFRYNTSEYMRLDDSGNLLVGTTSAVNGDSANTKRVVGGNFATFFGSATVPASSTATVLTLPTNKAGMYLIAGQFGVQNNDVYGSMMIVVANGTDFRIALNNSGSNATLSMSGANVQIANALGVPLDATATATFIGA